MFSHNTSSDAKKEICDMLRVQESDGTQYLGLPAIIGRNKKEIFSNIKDKI